MLIGAYSDDANVRCFGFLAPRRAILARTLEILAMQKVEGSSPFIRFARKARQPGPFAFLRSKLPPGAEWLESSPCQGTARSARSLMPRSIR